MLVENYTGSHCQGRRGEQMKHKHTATPWTKYKRMPGKCTIEISRLGLRTVIARIDDDELCPEHHGHYEANAEFICRAVNSHDELVEALKDAVRTLRTDGYSDFTLQRPLDAIAKAEKGRD